MSRPGKAMGKFPDVSLHSANFSVASDDVDGLGGALHADKLILGFSKLRIHVMVIRVWSFIMHYITT